MKKMDAVKIIKKKRITIPLIVEFILVFLVIQAFIIWSSIDLFDKGIAYQAITNEAESAHSLGKSIQLTLFSYFDDIPWLFEYLINHPDLMKISGDTDNVGTEYKALGNKYGWNDHWLLKSDIDSMSEPEKAECARVIYKYLYACVAKYSVDSKDTLDYPMISATIDSKNYMLINLENKYPYKSGDTFSMTKSDNLPEASESEKQSNLYIGDEYFKIERTNTGEKNYGVIACPIQRDGNLYGHIIVGISSSVLEKTNTRLAQTSLNYLNFITIGAAVLLLVFALVFIIVPINRIHNGVKEYTKEKDSEKLKLMMEKVRSRNEIGYLSDGISNMADEIQDYIEETARITEEQSKAEAELSFAKRIQSSAVPADFPPFPDRTEFGLHAMMDTAKIVGGDFYDYFFNKDGKLVLVIADVSDKGVPAAMFMMRAMTLIRSYVLQGLPVDEATTCTNIALCEKNEENMFVTAWIGYIDLQTGAVEFVHAGHTKPVISGKRGTKYINRMSELMLGSFENSIYHTQTWKLRPGDTLFLYTDGVNEAVDESSAMYGEKRLLDVIADCSEKLDKHDLNQYCEQICQSVYADVKKYAGEAEQADDITMISFYFAGK
ncbi:MAG: serine/threonine-protein phosphatase [Eubacterium sp.]|nr:serine/threonine-protein phosphatase [Eubacterium sp.]